MSFGLFTMARQVVKAAHAGMRVEAYVFDPWLEVWVQNFRLRGSGEVGFVVNEPNRAMALVKLAPAVASDGMAVFRRPWDADEGPARAFFANPDNERDVRDLQLGTGESLTILSHQITARLKAGDDDRVRARFEVLGRLFARNTRAAAPPATVLEPHALAVGESATGSVTSHRFGGVVEGDPRCGNCRRPLHQLLSLDTQAPPLGTSVKGLPRLPVAACLNCQPLSSPLVLARGPGGWIIREQAASPSFEDFAAPLPERTVRLEAVADRQSSVTGHRVGGLPTWIQSDETPDCPGCGQPMAFVAQLDTDDRLGIQFGDDGRLYGFVCSGCVMVATLIQST